ncbi:MAG: chemotaxis protein CheC [Planctomycetota bacterium]
MELSVDDTDALGEIINIGVGRAASSLSDLLGTAIQLQIPRIRIADRSDEELQSSDGISVVQGFAGRVAGNALLAFSNESGRKLANLVGDCEPAEMLDSFELAGILSELGNIVLNGVLGSLANAIGADLVFQVPEFFLDESITSLIEQRRGASPATGPILIADAKFSVDDLDIEGSVVIAFSLGSLQSLSEALEAVYQ